MKGVMKMAIQPISRTDYVSHVSFGDKHKKGCKPDGGQHMTSAAKAVPIAAVLIAMSPLNQSAAADKYNRQIASSPTTEVVVQNPQEPQKPKLPEWGVSTGGETFVVWGVSRDNNPNDAETFLFKYHRDLENNKVAVLSGQFLAVSDTPREDGRHLMMFSPLDESEHVNGKYEIAYVKPGYDVPLAIVSNSPANNKASVIAPWGAFVKKFGEEAVNNAPNIEDATNFVLNKKY